MNLGVDGVVGPETWKNITAKNLIKRVVAPTPIPIKPKKTISESVEEFPHNKINSDYWMSVAQKEADLGVRRLNEPGVHHPRIVLYHSTTTYNAKEDETPWCSSFANWVLTEAGFKGTNSAAAISWANWGAASEAKYGAIAVIHDSKRGQRESRSSGNHVGFVTSISATYIELLGGNQSNSVKKSRYPFSTWKIVATRWPTINDVKEIKK